MKCKLLENQVYIGVNGQYRMCCISLEHNNKETIWTHTPQEWLNSKTIKQAKKTFENNQWPAACQKCQFEEKIGNVSKRIKDQSYGPGITHLDLRLGNSCNLKCISCNPTSSSSIADESIIMQSKGIIPIYSFYNDSVLNWCEESLFSRFENLPLKEVYFAGGEPMMIKYLDQLLERLDRSITLRFNTNATIINPKINKLLKQYNKVIMSLSIDGIGKRNEYIRYGSKWNDIEKNISIFSEFCEVNITPCISVLNGAYYDEIIDWSNQQGFKVYENMLLNPSWLHVKNAPRSLKEKFINIEAWKNEESDLLQEQAFVHYIKKLDSFRKIKINDYLPEVAKAYGIN